MNVRATRAWKEGREKRGEKKVTDDLEAEREGERGRRQCLGKGKKNKADKTESVPPPPTMGHYTLLVL